MINELVVEVVLGNVVVEEVGLGVVEVDELVLRVVVSELVLSEVVSELVLRDVVVVEVDLRTVVDVVVDELVLRDVVVDEVDFRVVVGGELVLATRRANAGRGRLFWSVPPIAKIGSPTYSTLGSAGTAEMIVAASAKRVAVMDFMLKLVSSVKLFAKLC